MKTLFISDVHGVPSALKAALAKGESLGFDVPALPGCDIEADRIHTP